MSVYYLTSCRCGWQRNYTRRWLANLGWFLHARREHRAEIQIPPDFLFGHDDD